MLRKLFQRVGVVLGSLVLLLILGYSFIYASTELRINKVYQVTPQYLFIPDDSASYMAGRHVAEIRRCLACHGADLAAGKVVADEHSPVGRLYTSNITSGRGGIHYTDQDWIRALRHGLGKDNKALWGMPSHEFCGLSNQDMAALICYVKKQPPVDRTQPPKSLKPFGRILTFVGELPLLAAERIDHTAIYAEDVEPAVDVPYGKYLAVSCTGCHTATFKGGPACSPGQPPIPDISSTGRLGKWTQQEFVNVFRLGKTPENQAVSACLPIKATYSDNEVRAIYLYLREAK